MNIWNKFRPKNTKPPTKPNPTHPRSCTRCPRRGCRWSRRSPRKWFRRHSSRASPRRGCSTRSSPGRGRRTTPARRSRSSRSPYSTRRCTRSLPVRLRCGCRDWLGPLLVKQLIAKNTLRSNVMDACMYLCTKAKVVRTVRQHKNVRVLLTTIYTKYYIGWWVFRDCCPSIGTVVYVYICRYNNKILREQYKTSRACWLVLRVEIETNQSTHKKTTKLRRREILRT